jgi:hypothetical protein
MKITTTPIYRLDLVEAKKTVKEIRQSNKLEHLLLLGHFYKTSYLWFLYSPKESFPSSIF